MTTVNQITVNQITVGQTTVGQTTADKTTVDKTAVDKTTVDNAAVDETAVAQTSVDETAGGRTTTHQLPAAVQARVDVTRVSARDPESFAARHIGPDDPELAALLQALDQPDLDALEAAVVPTPVRLKKPFDLPPARSEIAALARLRELAGRNRPLVAMIGLGYHDTVVPAVIKRNVLENPAWYTAYTPYQPEISQGRLEALLNFQTAVAELTGLDLANASMLDEASAAAEAMTLIRRSGRSRSTRFAVDADTLPQTKAVLATRAEPLDIELVEFADTLPNGDFFGVLVAYPGASGKVRDHAELVHQAHERGAKVAVATDLLALTLLRPPGEIGADVAIGSSQRFGVPLGFGGPHAGFLAVRADLQRQLPGRLVGVSHDAHGRTAYRLALQTREQHIRREKATSNICTAQVLLAVMASMYAVYHGPEGLTAIARRVSAQARRLASMLTSSGVLVVHEAFFDTVQARVPGRAAAVVLAARRAGINLWPVDADTVQISVSERTTQAHLLAVLQAFDPTAAWTAPVVEADLPADLTRTSAFLTHPIFHRYRSETAMLRYLRRLSDSDLALDRTMIPLGSCTMKLNATAEMEPVTWPEFADLHPYAPIEDAAGTMAVIDELERWLCEITGYAAVSLQPNAGSQGELAGLLAIRAFHRSRGESHRTVCLIPASAHGTNAASAVMAGMRVVVVGTDQSESGAGRIDLADLRAKIDAHADELAAIMVTYPSTHGVFEDSISDVAAWVHAAGGQVYVDGANLNALVGVGRPGDFGGDVSHLNLHKTFCIPHGGGGPGVGPVAVAAHLAPFLPGHPLAGRLDLPRLGGDHARFGRSVAEGGVGAVAAAPWGSASILPISWAYIAMMGHDGLRRATLTAIASANYLARRLDEHFPVLYTDAAGFVAHECILDLRPISAATGVSVDDVAKRLADYGFHAPTTSFPVPGTLMVEPTESENLAELDRFCAAMIAIRAEIDQVASGRWALTDSPLRHAPHTAMELAADWDRPYSRSQGVFPPGVEPAHKYFPPVSRIDGAYGDRNLVCACPPPEAFAD